MNEEDYRLPNGCLLQAGGRVRIPREHLWHIPEADVEAYDIRLDLNAYSPDSEVVWRPRVAPPEEHRP